ncbi:energy-coupling factor transporter transmembrane protein EcfT [bacterium]|nr:energy-coupling factor transporter transmembrane protein EcfT [bacterium]
MRNLTLGQYLPRDSVIHRLDPRSKFLFFLVLVSFFILFNSIETHLAGLLVLFILMIMAKLHLVNLLTLVRTFRLFFYITFLVHLIFTPAEGGYQWHWFSVSLEGAWNGLLFSLRLFLLVFSGALLTWTTQPIEFTNALERFLEPLNRRGIPVRNFTLMMMIALRFIPTMIDEIENTRKAQLARGARFGGGLLKRIKALLPLIIPLFAQSFRRAETLSLALEVRAYTPDHPRTYYKPLKYHTGDWILTLLTGSLLTGLVYFKMTF